MSDTPAKASPHVAALGEHIEELLAKVGYSRAQISGFASPAKSGPPA
jgi:crotonobetainyl-CoA:carnitine CoA-transferase CaiB-like acyl-CoA transferase